MTSRDTFLEHKTPLCTKSIAKNSHSYSSLISDLPRELVESVDGILCAAALNSSAVLLVSRRPGDIFVLELPGLVFRKVVAGGGRRRDFLQDPNHAFCGIASKSRSGAEVVVIETRYGDHGKYRL